MNAHNLQVFREVVDRQGITAAASHLYMTQPAVTAHIRRLEKQFQAKLLYQSGRKLVPTESGQRLYEFAASTLTSLQRVRNSISDHESGTRGVATLATLHGLAEQLVIPVFARFQQTVPTSQIVLRVGDKRTVAQLVASGDVDFALTQELPNASEHAHLRVDLIREEPVVIIAQSGSPLACRERVSAEELKTEQLLRGVPTSAGQQELDRYLLELGLADRELRLAAGSPECLVAAVRHSMGIAMMYRCFASHDLQEGQVVALDVAGLHASCRLVLITRENAYLSPLAQSLWRYLRTELAA